MLPMLKNTDVNGSTNLFIYFQTRYFKNCLIIVEADYSALHVIIRDNPEKSNCNVDVEKRKRT